MNFLRTILLSLNLVAIATAVFSAPIKNKPITSFKFELLTGGVMLCKAGLENPSDSLNFIIDTGGSGIALDSSTAEELKLQPIETNTNIIGIGGIRKAKFLYNKKLFLPGLIIDSLDFHVSNYDLLSSCLGIKIDGIIGYSFFCRYVVAINYDKNEILVYDPKQYNFPNKGEVLYPVIKKLLFQNTEMGTDSLKDKSLILDTGAGLCLMINEKAKNNDWNPKGKYGEYLVSTDGVGGKQQANLSVINRFKLGKYVFKKLPVYYFVDTNNITNYPYSIGILGNEILRRFNTIFDYHHSQIHITPNSHFSDPFDYAYTGLNLYSENGKILITEVMKNSPAEAAGFMQDDVLLAIDNNIVQDMQQCKQMLQTTESKMLVWILRKEKAMKLLLKPKNILDRKNNQNHYK